MKVKSLCLPILAENPFAKGDKEKELITAIALEDQGIADVPEESSADDSFEKARECQGSI